MNETLNRFREGVIAERGLADTAVARRWGVEQWHARCVHLAEEIGRVRERDSTPFVPRTYGRLAVALFTLEGIETS